MASAEDIAHQRKLLDIHRQNLKHYANQLAVHGAAYAPPAVMHGINEARAGIAQAKRILRGWGEAVADEPGDVEPAPEAQGSAGAPQTPPAIDLPRLRQLIVEHFNDTELRDLCFDLGIDYEDLGGEGKGAKARELVAYCNRRGRVVELVAQCRKLRPNVAW